MALKVVVEGPAVEGGVFMKLKHYIEDHRNEPVRSVKLRSQFEIGLPIFMPYKWPLIFSANFVRNPICICKKK